VGIFRRNSERQSRQKHHSNAHQIVIPTLGWIKEMKLDTVVLEYRTRIQSKIAGARMRGCTPLVAFEEPDNATATVA
jgi:hypothetical protein